MLILLLRERIKLTVDDHTAYFPDGKVNRFDQVPVQNRQLYPQYVRVPRLPLAVLERLLLRPEPLPTAAGVWWQRAG